MQINVSLDNITFVGQPTDNARERLLDFPFVKYSYVTPHGRYHDNFAIEQNGFVQVSPPHSAEKQIRFEFNPNKLDINKEGKQAIKDIMKLFISPKVTRMDIAIDLHDIDLSHFHIMDFKSRKTITYQSGAGRLETKYIGGKDSDQRIRLYDKALEQKVKHDLYKLWYVQYWTNRPTTIEIFKKDIAILPRPKRKKRKLKKEERMNWWRVEGQIRKEKAESIYFNPFYDVLAIQKYGNLDGMKIQDRAMIEYLMNHPDEWGDLSPNTRKKYKNIIAGYLIHTELDFYSMYEEHKKKITDQVEKYLIYIDPITNFMKGGLTFVEHDNN